MNPACSAVSLDLEWASFLTSEYEVLREVSPMLLLVKTAGKKAVSYVLLVKTAGKTAGVLCYF